MPGSGATPARSHASRIWRASSRCAGRSGAGGWTFTVASSGSSRRTSKSAVTVPSEVWRVRCVVIEIGHVDERADGAHDLVEREVEGDAAVVAARVHVHDAGARVDRALGLLGDLGRRVRQLLGDLAVAAAVERSDDQDRVGHPPLPSR